MRRSRYIVIVTLSALIIGFSQMSALAYEDVEDPVIIKHTSQVVYSDTYVDTWIPEVVDDNDVESPWESKQIGDQSFWAKDYKNAWIYYFRAGNRGNAEGQNALGNLYMSGLGVSKDYSLAMDWYIRSARQGYAPAQVNVGLCYSNGRDIKVDYESAVYWFYKAAKQNDAAGQFYLGWMLEHGSGIPKDVEKAKMWYSKSAKQGYADAITQLNKFKTGKR